MTNKAELVATEETMHGLVYEKIAGIILMTLTSGMVICAVKITGMIMIK